MEIQKIKYINVVSDKEGTSKRNEPWRVIEFQCETDEQFPKKIVFKIFSLNGNKQKLIDFIYNLPANADIHVRFDVESKEFNGRWYTEVNVWDCFKAVADTSKQNGTITPKKEEVAANQTKQSPLPALEQQSAAPVEDNDNPEDLPF